MAPFNELKQAAIIKMSDWSSNVCYTFNTSDRRIVRVLFRVHVRLCFQQHITYNSVSRSKSREKETEKKDTDGMQVRSKEKKEEKDRKDRKRVSA